MSWTDDRVAILKKMWKDGHSAADIAKELGEGVTRNAVIGKAHRMGLSGRPSPIKGKSSDKSTAKKSTAKKATKKTETKAKKETKEKKTTTRARKATTNSKVAKKTTNSTLKSELDREEIVISNIDTENPPADGGVALIDLTERMCKWPYGDPREEGFTFCGRECYPGKPYCPDHVLAAYQSSSKSRTAAKAKDAKALEEGEDVEDLDEDLDVDIDEVDGEVDEDKVGSVD